ncbi:MAG: prepilin-type N-terminal cleavage/methylation domain-containing protein [Opitutales bacterium]
MKQANRKKGFSLIELIVVIAVIAAIAAVIVPSVSNFNTEAKRTSDRRNVQLWNQTYLEARAAGATVPTSLTSTTVAPVIATSINVGDTSVSFNAPTFSTSVGTMVFANDTGIVYTNNM